jgi:WD40 repeat protein
MDILQYTQDDTTSVFSSEQYFKNKQQNNMMSPEFQLHSSTLRTLKFSPDGTSMATGGSDGRMNLFDNTKMELVYSKLDAHPAPLYSLCYLNDHVIASGDDNGNLMLWDLRQSLEKNPICDVYEQEDGTISSIKFLEKDNQIFCSCTNGTLGVYDLRMVNSQIQLKLHAMSDFMEEELNDVCLMKHGNIIATGTSNGVVQLFKSGWYGDCKDRLTGHPYSIDSMIEYNENILITGSEDGWVRFCNIHPNTVAVFEQHEEDSDDPYEFPILKISLSHCKNYLASISNDRCVRFYELGNVEEKVMNNGNAMVQQAKDKGGIQEEDSDDDMFEEEKPKKKKKNQDLDKMKKQNFFEEF